MTGVRAVALALACAALAAAGPARAATPARAAAPAATPHDGRIPGTNVLESELPLRFASTPRSEMLRTQRPVPPLDPAHEIRRRLADDLLAGGMAARARDSLRTLDREVPHHALLVLDLAQAELAAGDERAAITRLLAERAALRDSLLGAHPLAAALEHAGRTREAAQVTLEAWAVTPLEGAWALGTLAHLATADPRGVSELLHAAAAARPWRDDLLRGEALLLGRRGQPAEAARLLAAADGPAAGALLRRRFADELGTSRVRADSLAAFESLVSLAADTAWTARVRTGAAWRANDLAVSQPDRGAALLRIVQSLHGVPIERWGPELVLALSHALRETGHAPQAQALLAGAGALGERAPELEFERLLGVLREGPPERALGGLDTLAHAWPAAHFMLAEAQFWCGNADSALANYQRTADDPASADGMTALDRMYMIEEKPGAPELRMLGTLGWERWRGDGLRARAIADSLWQTLPLGSPYYARAAFAASELRADAGDLAGSLAPLAMVADSLPGDRLAPLARQRAGETWLRLGDERRAVAQFEDCLARYPRAWNAAEVRRTLDRLRRDRRF